jgi:tripartite-type tricarboxylate transporter receptor subunit TctC
MVSAAAGAQSYPTRPIELVVPYGPGGTGDLIARILSAKLEPRLREPVIVLNRPGASGTIGASSVARAQPDGYTLLLGYTNEMVIAPELSKDVSYRLTSFEPIAFGGRTPLVLVGSPKLAPNTLQELIATLRAGGRRYTYAAGTSSPPHFTAELFKRATGVELDHVFYKGSAQGVSDVLGGHVDLYFAGIPAARSLVESGKLKAYAVTGARRSPALPDMPTMAEAGLVGFELYGWFALFGPAGGKMEITDLLRAETNIALGAMDARAKLLNDGVEPNPIDAGELKTFLSGEAERYRRLVGDLSLSVR